MWLNWKQNWLILFFFLVYAGLQPHKSLPHATAMELAILGFKDLETHNPSEHYIAVVCPHCLHLLDA